MNNFFASAAASSSLYNRITFCRRFVEMDEALNAINTWECNIENSKKLSKGVEHSELTCDAA